MGKHTLCIESRPKLRKQTYVNVFRDLTSGRYIGVLAADTEYIRSIKGKKEYPMS